jgi:Protein of unknown function (DUF3570)
VDIVSSASSRWTELRHEASLSASYALAAATIDGSFSASREPDYLFWGAGARLGLELSGSRINPTFGYTFAHDTAGRTGTPWSVFSRELTRHAFVAGVELIVDRSTSLFLQADAILELGDSAKPYRFLPLFSPETAPLLAPGATLSEVNRRRLPGRIGERVPDQRLRLAAFGRLSRRLLGATFQATERLYADDWLLWASTSELRYLRDVGARWVLWAGARGHVQSGVYFWRRAYVGQVTSGAVTVPSYRTGDRELGPLLAATLGVGARYGFGPRARPHTRSVSLQLDESATSFRDALYLGSRFAQLVVLQLEAEL